MKLDNVEKLLRAAKAKAQLENARLTALRSVQEKLIAEADEIARGLKVPLIEGVADLRGADLLLGARHEKHLENAENGKRKTAGLLDPQRLEQEAALKTSLREEISWARLAQSLERVRRKAIEDHEEEKREELARRRGAPK